MTLDQMKAYLQGYDGKEINIMEVCGSHTAAIAKNGIPGMLSPRIHLLSGPGCPVCVTPSAYVDKLIELADSGKVIVTFGDMIRIPGSKESLSEAKGRGIRVEMVYSPFDIISMAKAAADDEFVFAAVGFETTTPIYALLIEHLIKEEIKNVKLLTALKTMPGVIDHVMASGADIDGFIAPGHVSVVTGTGIYKPIAEKYSIPFGVSGFEGEQLLKALCGIVASVGRGVVHNFYHEAVRDEGNISANEIINRYFKEDDAMWRGMGIIPGSGRYLKEEYVSFDAGSFGLNDDEIKNKACRCSEVLMGKIKPMECPLFKKVCTPLSPQGACMVSEEGNCHSYLVNGRDDL
ncbi:MAG: hydrogenase formation protein HypD [Lachnospiraceae bacterium]|nr:hydrogenase formation protein HypD [Lachnospiraceae bacterium]